MGRRKVRIARYTIDTKKSRIKFLYRLCVKLFHVKKFLLMDCNKKRGVQIYLGPCFTIVLVTFSETIFLFQIDMSFVLTFPSLSSRPCHGSNLLSATATESRRSTLCTFRNLTDTATRCPTAFSKPHTRRSWKDAIARQGKLHLSHLFIKPVNASVLPHCARGTKIDGRFSYTQEVDVRLGAWQDNSYLPR